MPRKAPLLLVLFITLACNGLANDPTTAAAPAPSAVTAVDIPNAIVTYYDIQGATGQELREQLNRFGLVGADGYRGDAKTDWYITWTWKGYGTENCDLQTVTVTHDIQVTMPRWIPPSDAPPELVAKWGEYILVLAEHEKGHVDNVIAHLPSLVDAIQRATCLTAEARAQEALDTIRQYDLDYDARTRHGETQGAVFP